LKVVDKVIKICGDVYHATKTLTASVKKITDLRQEVREMSDIVDDDENMVYPHLPDWSTINAMPIYSRCIGALGDMIALEQEDVGKVREYNEKMEFETELYARIEAFKDFQKQQEEDDDELEYEEKTPNSSKKRSRVSK